MRPFNPIIAVFLLLNLLFSSAHAGSSTDPFGVVQALGLSSPATYGGYTPSTPVKPPASPAAPAAATSTTGASASGITNTGPNIAPSAPPPADTSTSSAIVTPDTPQQSGNNSNGNNGNNNVFGANLFTGAFAHSGPTQFNPDYAIAIGDQIQVRFWGAFDYDAPVTVDPKGNIFLPHVGPVPVRGVRNQDLQRLVDASVRKVFLSNVYSYASLADAQPVRVFVGGFVNRPGLYAGTSMDSLLHYLDQAGGIDLSRGSFINVQVKRGDLVRITVNLYDFMLKGRMPLVQLADGDIIFVQPLEPTVTVTGLAHNTYQFEIDSRLHTIGDIFPMAQPLVEATHFRVTRNTGSVKNIEYYPLTEANKIRLDDGDEVEFTADKKPGTITVRVEGEHLNPQEYVLPYGTRLGELMHKIHLNDRADKSSLQLFRESVQDRQKSMMDATLRKLEASVLTARSGTTDESQLRTSEAAMFLQWVDRAKTLQPSGQVLLSHADNLEGLLLEEGDRINIPAVDSLVLVSGEVLFPNTIALDSSKNIEDYVQAAGGFTQNADSSRIIIAHMDGSYENIEETESWFGGAEIRTGDQILVLPKVDAKYRQLFKELLTMAYQMGLGAKVFVK